jgi:hypothetical protein
MLEEPVVVGKYIKRTILLGHRDARDLGPDVLYRAAFRALRAGWDLMRPQSIVCEFGYVLPEFRSSLDDLPRRGLHLLEANWPPVIDKGWTAENRRDVTTRVEALALNGVDAAEATSLRELLSLPERHSDGVRDLVNMNVNAFLVRLDDATENPSALRYSPQFHPDEVHSVPLLTVDGKRRFPSPHPNGYRAKSNASVKAFVEALEAEGWQGNRDGAPLPSSLVDNIEEAPERSHED